MNGGELGYIVCDDLRRLLQLKGDHWSGCIEWNVDDAGKVHVDASNTADTRRLHSNDDRPVIERPVVADVNADADADTVLFKMFVRLEPGVYHGQELGVVSRVLTINNVALAEPLTGRGVFGSLLGVLEAWMRDEGDACRPRAIMVQNVCNERLMAWLKNRPGWSTFPGEDRSVMLLV